MLWKRIFFGLLISVFWQCSSPAKRPNTSVEIEIDENVQLLRLAYNLALEDSIEPYLRPCRNRFYELNHIPYLKFKQHPLVKTIREGDVWNADLPVLGLCFTDDFILKENVDQDILKSQYGWYGANLDSLGQLLASFKKQTRFSWKGDLPEKEKLLDSIRSNKLHDKLGVFFKSNKEIVLNICFDPLNNVTNKAIMFLDISGAERTILLGSFCEEALFPENDSILPWDEDTRRIIIHEMSHLYVDPIFPEMFETYFGKSDDPSFEYEMNEALVRGITSFIIRQDYGIEEGDKDISWQPEASKQVYEALKGINHTSHVGFTDIYSILMLRLRDSITGNRE